jgi:ParB family chromosome partitioning protein
VALAANQISMAHARAIISVEDAESQITILHEIIAKDLSVRQVEQMVKSMAEPKITTTKTKDELPQLHKDTKKELHDYIQSQVEIKRSRKGKGTLTIHFNNDSDFERIVSLIKK